MKLVFLFFISAVFMGCASSTPQTDSLRHKNRFAEIPNVPFVEQPENYCGPAALTMALNWNGRSVTLDEIASQVYTPGMKGTFQTDLISAARRNGMIAIPIAGMESLLKELDAGNPVIVFENLALTWAPQYHYAIVYGYDLDNQIMMMHSGPEKAKRWDIRKFERSWKLVDYWGLVVLNPGKLSASASELNHVSATAGLEQLKKYPEALESYKSILNRWPESQSALIGLGNVYYAQNNFSSSVQALKKAVKLYPDSIAAQNNLRIAEQALKNRSDNLKQK